MKRFPVIEKFISINGEGPAAGALAAFIRFEGCNLRCAWCDTTYAFQSEQKEWLTAKEIYTYIKESKVKYVTLTGGEPLLQEDIGELLELLDKDNELITYIETNGSLDITKFKKTYTRGAIYYIVDYKLPSSHMSERMEKSNLHIVTKEDVYKFVVGSEEDLEEAYKIIQTYQLEKRCQVYLSPVLSQIKPHTLVAFMKQRRLREVKLQLQLHKIIWPEVERGV